MKPWKLWVGMFLVFAAGVIGGIVGSALYVRHTVRAIVFDGPRVVNQLVTKKLVRELNLSDQQADAIAHIVWDTQHRLHGVRQRYRPETEHIVAASIVKMKGELTAEQARKLDALYSGLRDRWSARDRQFAR